MTDDHRPWPTELKLASGGKTLFVSFDDEMKSELEAWFLRVESPSAEVQGHGAGQKKLVTGKEQVSINKIEPVGNYAVRLIFDDGHDSGLFTWDYLHELGQDKENRQAAYHQRAAEAERKKR